MLTDLRYAIRGLLKTPGFTAAVVITLALGIGANTALFSILNGLVLKTLPVPEPERLVLLTKGSWTNPIWEEIRGRQDRLFDGAFAWSNERFNLSEHGETSYVDGVYASGGMFKVLGVQAIRGRTLTQEDDVKGGGPDGAVAVISHDLWQRKFSGAADVVGRRLTVERVPFTIVGVAPPGFFGPEVGRIADLFIPLGDEFLIRGPESNLDGRSSSWLEIMARLKTGETLEQANALLWGVQPQIKAATLPDWRQEDLQTYLRDPLTFAAAATGRSALRMRYQQPLAIIMVVVGAVLLITCANIANLLLARASGRRHELVVRSALGASRLDLARHLFAESVVLSVIGAILGLAFATFATKLVVQQLATPATAVFLDTALDWRALLFTTGLALSTALLFGLAPALGLRRVSATEVLKEQSRGVTGDRGLGLRNCLVVTQVALSLVLVVAAALFLRTFSALMTVPLGFNPSPLLVIDVNTQHSQVPPQQRAALFERLRNAAIAVPGVGNGALSVIRPLSGRGWNTRITIPGGPEKATRDRISWVNGVSPEWFATYGIRMLAGRDFTEADREGGSPVAIVNESFARKFLSGTGSAVGREFRTENLSLSASASSYQVVGVVADAVYRRPREGVLPTLYLPMAQIEELSPTMTLALQVPEASRSALAHGVLDALGRVDSALTFTLSPFNDQIRASVVQERLIALLSGFFGGLALLLAAVGLYGVTSYSVNRRQAEIGLRMALGADAGEIRRLVLGRIGSLVASGVLAGALMSWWASRFIARSLLFGLEARDPSSFVLAVAVLACVGAIAGWLPARRATRIDPAQALREA